MCISQTHNHGFCNKCYIDWSTTCTQNYTNITYPICNILIQEYIPKEDNISEIIVVNFEDIINNYQENDIS